MTYYIVKGTLINFQLNNLYFNDKRQPSRKSILFLHTLFITYVQLYMMCYRLVLFVKWLDFHISIQLFKKHFLFIAHDYEC